MLEMFRPTPEVEVKAYITSKAYRRTLREHNDLKGIYQSDYRRGHSTETALLKVLSDLSEAFDEGYMTPLSICLIYTSFQRNRSPNSAEAFRMLLWMQEKSLNLCKVVIH